MEIVLKNIYVREKRNGKTVAFQATLYVNGYKVGIVSNEGKGGAIQYHPLEDKGNFLIREAEAWCGKFPPVIFHDILVVGKPMAIPMDFETYLDNIITSWLNEKDAEQFRKKMEEEMETAILFGIPGKTFRVLKYKKRISRLIMFNAGLERLKLDIHEKVIPLLRGNEKILNTNIPAVIVKQLGVVDGKWVDLATGR